MAIRHQRHHLMMRKFPSRRVPEGGRGPWGYTACTDATLLPQHATGLARLSRALSHLPSPTSKSSSVLNPRCQGYVVEESWIRSQDGEAEGLTNDTLIERPARAASGICLVTAVRTRTGLGRRDTGPLPLVFCMAPTTGSPGQWEAVPDDLYGDRCLHRCCELQGLPRVPRDSLRSHSWI